MTIKKKIALGSILAVSIIACIAILLYPLFIRIASKNSSYANLTHLRWLPYEAFSTSDVNFYAIAKRFSVGGVEIVSAEKVFSSLDPRLDWVDNYLVSRNYRIAVKSASPGSNSSVGDWDSSFFSWGMPVDKWQSTPDFRWKEMHFPYIWDKRPDLNDDKVNYLAIDDPSVETLPSSEFEILKQKAFEWLEPERVSREKLENIITNGTEDEKVFAIRMLGRKQDKKGLELIKPFLKGENRQLKEAAEYALKKIERE